MSNEVMRREVGAPHPGASRLSLSPLAGRGALLLLLLATAASAAVLRDNVKQPGKIKDAFPKSAKLRVVNIWATWCVPCVAEMPELRKTAAALGSEAAFVGVSVDDTIPDAKPA